jgi:hypothetical protein
MTCPENRSSGLAVERRRERAQRREPRDRIALSERRARARVGESEGEVPSKNNA